MLLKLVNIIVVACVLLWSGFSNAHHLEFSDSVVRAAIPGMKSTAGFFSVANHSSQPEKLISVSASIAKKVEFHNHEMANGQMKMVKLDQILLPANSTVTFESGGLHLMFIGLLQHPKSVVDVEFKTESGRQFVIEFDVKSILDKHQH